MKEKTLLEVAMKDIIQKNVIGEAMLWKAITKVIMKQKL